MTRNATPARIAMMMVNWSVSFLERRLLSLDRSYHAGDGAHLRLHAGGGDDHGARPRHCQPMKATKCWSPSATSALSMAAILERGRASPVSAASSIFSVAASTSRPSAGTRRPLQRARRRPAPGHRPPPERPGRCAARAPATASSLKRGQAGLGLLLLAHAEDSVEDGEDEEQ